MRYESIADIYSANEKVREHLYTTVTNIDASKAMELPDVEKWSIQQIVEHIAIVEQGVSRICARLLETAKATNKPSDGSFSLSDDFAAKSVQIADVKVEAPERVHPTGEVPIAKALELIKENQLTLNAMRGDMERYDLSNAKFPHPFFGDLTAAEWLVMLGGHGARHTDQIKRILEKIG